MRALKNYYDDMDRVEGKRLVSDFFDDTGSSLYHLRMHVQQGYGLLHFYIRNSPTFWAGEYVDSFQFLEVRTEHDQPRIDRWHLLFTLNHEAMSDEDLLETVLISLVREMEVLAKK